ncbi:MAG: hypothetical protein ACQESR_25825 [Planctomycetota bacterium]
MTKNAIENRSDKKEIGSHIQAAGKEHKQKLRVYKDRDLGKLLAVVNIHCVTPKALQRALDEKATTGRLSSPARPAAASEGAVCVLQTINSFFFPYAFAHHSRSKSRLKSRYSRYGEKTSSVIVPS